MAGVNTNAKKESKRYVISVRVSESTKEKIADLIDAVSGELGARVNLSQALEVAVNEALEKRAGKE